MQALSDRVQVLAQVKYTDTAIRTRRFRRCKTFQFHQFFSPEFSPALASTMLTLTAAIGSTWSNVILFKQSIAYTARPERQVYQ